MVTSVVSCSFFQKFDLKLLGSEWRFLQLYLNEDSNTVTELVTSQRLFSFNLSVLVQTFNVFFFFVLKKAALLTVTV